MSTEQEWDPPLPDTTKWQPRTDKRETLADAFLRRCSDIEESIIARSRRERAMNIDNFDSGPGVEDIVREELANLLPSRYRVKAGVINDRLGRTAGDFDVILFNELWFPALKAGATPASRRLHLPIEGVYGVLEVKQSINYLILDQAMEKLVSCHRLLRPPTSRGRIVENAKLDDCPHATTNPLFSCILATGLRSDVTMEGLINRFYDINKTLRRREVIRALCVLGHGCVCWAYDTGKSDTSLALFKGEDLYMSIFPVYFRVGDVRCAFHPLMMYLMAHLYDSILAAEDIPAHYGSDTEHPLVPSASNIRLGPDDNDRKEQEFVDNFFEHLSKSRYSEPTDRSGYKSMDMSPRPKRSVKRREARLQAKRRS